MFNTQFNAGASRDAIRKAFSQLQDMTPLFTDIAEYMIEATRSRFRTGTAPDGSKWAKKKQSTLDRYKARGYGNLSRALIGPGRALSRQIIGRGSRDGAVIGSALIYAQVMQDGARKGAFGTDRHKRPIPWGNIPARVWLGISKDDEKAIIETVEDYLEPTLNAGP